MSTLVQVINEEHRTNKKCDTFTIAKKPFVNPRMCLILPKHSEFTDYINKGFDKF